MNRNMTVAKSPKQLSKFGEGIKVSEDSRSKEVTIKKKEIVVRTWWCKKGMEGERRKQVKRYR